MTTGTPVSRAAASSSRRVWIAAVSSVADTQGTPASSASRTIVTSSPDGTAHATASTPSGSGVPGCHSIDDARSPMSSAT